jgi:SH3 domain-containing protein
LAADGEYESVETQSTEDMEKPFRRAQTAVPSPSRVKKPTRRSACAWLPAGVVALFLLTLVAPSHARDRKKKEDFGMGFSTQLSSPEDVVVQAVQAVVNDGMIEGSKEYNKDKFVDKAMAAESSSLFAAYTGPGKAFYKVREQVLAPENFKESNDQGTLAVRYIVESRGPLQTVLKIDAVFVEDFRRVVHPSDGSVESAEYREIQDRVDNAGLEKKQAVEGARHRQEDLAKKALERKASQEQEFLARVENSANTPEQRVETLRRQVERIVKAPGAQLRSAPFHSATSLKTLDAGSEVVILISTPYWYGVETENGEHGWVNHNQLESMP